MSFKSLIMDFAGVFGGILVYKKLLKMDI